MQPTALLIPWNASSGGVAVIAVKLVVRPDWNYQIHSKFACQILCQPNFQAPGLPLGVEPTWDSRRWFHDQFGVGQGLIGGLYPTFLAKVFPVQKRLAQQHDDEIVTTFIVNLSSRKHLNIDKIESNLRGHP